MKNEPEIVDPVTDESTGDDSAVPVAGLDDITDALADASPKPNGSAINASEEKAAAKTAEFADLRDVHGLRFDPAIHVTDADGNPKLTKTKKLRRKSGRKPGQTAKTIFDSKDRNVTGLSVDEKVQARATGEAAASALIMLGVVVGGDEWNPVIDESSGLDERQNLSHAFGDYFEQKELTDIPPGVALTIAISAYMIPRFTMPKTQTRFQTFKEWIATKLAKRRVRKNGSQSNIGNDRKRENDSGEGTSEKAKS